MKLQLTILCLLFVSGCATHDTVFFTSKLNKSEAVQAAQELRVGMREEQADKILQARGLGLSGRLGCSHGWGKFYSLADGTSLVLEIKPKSFRPDGAWVDGILESAHIQSGTNILTRISLKQEAGKKP